MNIQALLTNTVSEGVTSYKSFCWLFQSLTATYWTVSVQFLTGAIKILRTSVIKYNEYLHLPASIKYFSFGFNLFKIAKSMRRESKCFWLEFQDTSHNMFLH